MDARAALLACALALGACSRAHQGELASLRDALVRGDVARATALAEEACGARTKDVHLDAPYLDRLTARLGGKAFSSAPPDDASLAAAGVILSTRDGSALPGEDVWLAALAGSQGPGADVLRLCVATAMQHEASVLRKAAHRETDDAEVARAVARAVPGACAEYTAEGTTAETACVSRDLARGAPSKTGWSARERGAVASWVATTSAIDLGQDRMTGDARVALGKTMAIVRVATSELAAAP